MTDAWENTIVAEREAWCDALRAIGFTGDRDILRGPLSWCAADGGEATVEIEVTLTEAFPFSPPHVRLVNPAPTIDVTFHRDRDGSLCLWRTDVPVDTAPWREPHRLLDRVAEWLRETAAGWPDDDDCDLERYLSTDLRLVLYDRDLLAARRGCMATSTDAGGQRVTVTGELRQPPSRPHQKKGRPVRPNIGRKQRHLAWVADIGEVGRPIVDWISLHDVLGADADQVGWLVSIGVVEFVVLQYSRSGSHGVLALAVKRVSSRGACYDVQACESADTSVATRMLRSGASASDFADRRVAVVGVGAVGSFVADLMFRHGVRCLTLVDPELLRPGNVIRHLAGEAMVGFSKVSAVKARLNGLGFDVSKVDGRYERLTTPAQSVRLLREHQLVVDATACPRATALLSWAAETIDRPVVSVCIQRQGAVARIDRFPLRGAEHHWESLPPRRGVDVGSEHGCDMPVSPTPPVSVVAAAQLACRVGLDELTLECMLPPTLLDILIPQEAPYDVLGLRTSKPAPDRLL